MRFLSQSLKRSDRDTDEIVFQAVEPDGVGGVQARSVAGWSFSLAFDTEENPTVIGSQIGISNGDVTLAAEGKVIFPMDSISLPTGQVYFELESVDPEGKRRAQLRGEVRVRRGYQSVG